MAGGEASEQRLPDCRWADWGQMTSRRAVDSAEPASGVVGASEADLDCRWDDAYASWNRAWRSDERDEERARDVGEKRRSALAETLTAFPYAGRHFERGYGPSWAAAVVSASLAEATQARRRHRRRRHPSCLESRPGLYVHVVDWGTGAWLDRPR
jgi:hypothetical protein